MIRSLKPDVPKILESSHVVQLAKVVDDIFEPCHLHVVHSCCLSASALRYRARRASYKHEDFRVRHGKKVDECRVGVFRHFIDSLRLQTVTPNICLS